MYIREFRVMGRGDFPLDMLRYDCCWPAAGDDAAKIATSIYGLTDTEQRAWVKNQRVLLMRSYRAPTDARWSSFGWVVINEGLFRDMNSSKVEAYFNERAAT